MTLAPTARTIPARLSLAVADLLVKVRPLAAGVLTARDPGADLEALLSADEPDVAAREVLRTSKLIAQSTGARGTAAGRTALALFADGLLVTAPAPVQELRTALEVIALDSCHNFATGGPTPCMSRGRTAGALFEADRACVTCVARDALYRYAAAQQARAAARDILDDAADDLASHDCTCVVSGETDERCPRHGVAARALDEARSQL